MKGDDTVSRIILAVTMLGAVLIAMRLWAELPGNSGGFADG